MRRSAAPLLILLLSLFKAALCHGGTSMVLERDVVRLGADEKYLEYHR